MELVSIASHRLGPKGRQSVAPSVRAGNPVLDKFEAQKGRHQLVSHLRRSGTYCRIPPPSRAALLTGGPSDLRVNTACDRHLNSSYKMIPSGLYHTLP